MHFQLLCGLGGHRGAAFRVAQRVAEFFWLAQFIGVRALASPGDATQEHGAQRVVREVLVPVTGDADKGAVVVLLVAPDLWLNVIDVHALVLGHGFGRAGLSFLVALATGVAWLRCVSSCEDAGLGQDVHVVVDLVVDGEVRHVDRDRVFTIREVEMHGSFQPLGRALVIPRASDDRSEPRRVA